VIAESVAAVPGLVDSHAHLMDPAFDADLEAVLARAVDARVAGLVLVGYDLPTSHRAVDLAGRLPNATATVGIHPNSAGEATAADFDAIARLARSPYVSGIGETGLDYYRKHTSPPRQRQALAWHLRLAEELDLPVIIHNRDADHDVADLLRASAARRPANRPPGVLHCFSSTDVAYLDGMLAAGYAASFAGTLTYKSNEPLRTMAARVPLERLLVETDCPYLAPASRRGRRNEPALVRETAECLAGLHGLSLTQLTEHLWRNALRVFPAFERLVGSTL